MWNGWERKVISINYLLSADEQTEAAMVVGRS